MKFNQELAEIYKNIHDIESKNQFVLYLNKYEKSTLSKDDFKTLIICVQKIKKLLEWKKRQIAESIQRAEIETFKGFLEEIKQDTRTMLIIKKAIVKEVINKFKKSKPDQADDPVFLNYKAYLQDIDKELSQEKTVIETIIDCLKKSEDIKSKQESLNDLVPKLALQWKAGTKFINHITTHLINLYEEIQNPKETDNENIQDDSLFPSIESSAQDIPFFANKEDLNTGHDPELPVPVIEVKAKKDIYDFSFDDDELPEFDEMDETFVKNLAKIDDPAEMVEKINGLPGEHQMPVISLITFDPRFDKYYEEILKKLDNVGELLGIVVKRVKEIEKGSGFRAAEDYLLDLVKRIRKEKGKETLIEKKIENLLKNLRQSNIQKATRLRTLKAALTDQPIIKQIKILQEKASDPQFAGIFSALRNMERIALEKHFDEIFNELPVETQKIIGDGFLSDFKDLKQNYPWLYKKLEEKMKDVNRILSETYHATDDTILDKIMEWVQNCPELAQNAGQEEADQVINPVINQFNNLAKNLINGPGTKKDFDELGKIFAGDQRTSPSSYLNRLDNAFKAKDQGNKKLTRGQEIVQVMREIEALDDISDRINTIKFWLDNGCYSDQEHILDFLNSHVQALQEKKGRESGLIGRIFEHLRTIESVESKISYLKERLEDPDYVHLESVIKNLINNYMNDIKIETKGLSHIYIVNELEKINKQEDQLNWLKIRKELPEYNEYSSYIDKTITTIEKEKGNKIFEKLEEELAVKQAKAEILAKKTKGVKVTVYNDLPAFTSEILKIDNKLARKKFIKEQEALNPLSKQDMFFKQRKLLFYLLNTDHIDKPGLMLKALSDKATLTKDEKCAFIQLLKESLQTSPTGLFSLQDALNINDLDLAYYAAYALTTEKHSTLLKLKYYENWRDGRIYSGDIVYKTADGKEAVAKYREFFNIDYKVIDKLIEFFKNRVALSEGSQEEEEEDIVSWIDAKEKKNAGTQEKSNKEKVLNEHQNDLAFDPENIEQFDDEQDDELSNGSASPAPVIKKSSFDQLEEKNTETSGKNRANKPEKSPVPVKNENPAAKENKVDKPVEGQVKKEEAGKTDSKKPVKQEDSKAVNEQSNDVVNNPSYIQNKKAIDDKVLEKMKNSSKDIQVQADPQFRKSTKEIIDHSKHDEKAKISLIIKNLSTCQPDIIPELITQSIIPVLVEKEDFETRDMITTINQNIFIPVLYAGADVNVMEAVKSIESFLKKEGFIKNCMDDILAIIKKMRENRKFYINEEIVSEARQAYAIKAATGKGDISGILNSLLNMDSPYRIPNELQEKYIEPVMNNPQQKTLLTRLNMVKDIIQTSKEISWGSDTSLFDDKIKKTIMAVRERYKNAIDEARKNTSKLDDKKEESKEGTKEIKKEGKGSPAVPAPIETVLSNLSEFADPNKVIKEAVKADPALDKVYGGTNKEKRQEVINSLTIKGKIFTYDDRFYIGYGKLYGYINDKDNIGYPKEILSARLMNFLIQFSSPAQKAGFIGIPEDMLEEFLKKTERLAKKAPPDAAKPKVPVIEKPVATVKTAKPSQKDDKKPVSFFDSLFKPLDIKPTQSPKKDSPKRDSISKSTVKKETKSTPLTPKKEEKPATSHPAKSSASNVNLLKQLREMITEKMLFLIKETNNSEMLDMLFKSYISPKTNKSQLVNLLEPGKLKGLYDSIKEDTALHSKLSFDMDVVKKAYDKKMSKFK